jgi:outer membrane protein assembly factor BamB
MTRRGKLGFGVLLATCVVASSLETMSAASWPRFRGPNGAGVAADKDIPVEWKPENVLWKVPLPGSGNSSPVVWDKRLFVQSAGDNGKERLLLCLNVDDGKALWTRNVPGSTAHIHKLNSWASSTPAADGERVYAVFWDGKDIGLYAYTFQGDPVWHRGLGAFTSQHGPACSPVVQDGRVFLANDQDGTSVLLAFDAKTGKTLWEAPRKAYRTCYSTPFFLERPGRPAELIVSSTAGITAYDPRNGAEVWGWTWPHHNPDMPLRTVASAVAHDGLIFANSGDGSGARHTVVVKAGDKGAAGPTHLAWQSTQRALPYVPCMLAANGHLYYVTDLGQAACHEAKTGKVVWDQRLSTGFRASPVLIDGKVYAVSNDGDVFVFPAEPAFKLLAKNSLGEPVTASPAVADGRLFVRGARHLFCVGKAPAR